MNKMVPKGLSIIYIYAYNRISMCIYIYIDNYIYIYIHTYIQSHTVYIYIYMYIITLIPIHNHRNLPRTLMSSISDGEPEILTVSLPNRGLVGFTVPAKKDDYVTSFHERVDPVL